MKIISWNINGLRAVVKKGDLVAFLAKANPDILCLQEIKISEAKVEKENLQFPGYYLLTNGAQREGYSGTAMLVRESLFTKMPKAENGIGVPEFDDEGRIQILELPKAYVVNVYFPNANAELSRLNYKLNFNKALLKHLKKLETKKPIIITGDFNVAHQTIDLARPKENDGSAGFTREERESMDEFLAAGFIDTFRYLNDGLIQYSWWSYRMGARQRNVGWRIDYFCVSDKIKKSLEKAYILDQVLGSDHAPVGIEIKL
ncbi:MAG: exodeoxyribonuclease III [Candidatus Falkowbacteria bacterium]